MDIWHQCLSHASQGTIKQLANMDIGVKFIDSKFYKYKSCIVNKFKAYLYSKKYFTNIISEKIFFDLIFFNYAYRL